MSQVIEQAAADRQVAEAVAAEYESPSLECRADASRLERLLAPDFHGRAHERATARRRSGDGEVHIREPRKALEPDLALASHRGRTLADFPSPRHDRKPLTVRHGVMAEVRGIGAASGAARRLASSRAGHCPPRPGAQQSPAFSMPSVEPWRRRGKHGQLSISSDHFFAFLSVLTTFAPELSDSRGQN